MDAPQGPATQPFSFVLIPANEESQVEIQRFEGNSDDELRTTLRTYFAKVGGTMNESQRKELQQSFKNRLESTKKKQEAEEEMRKKMTTDSRVEEIKDSDDVEEKKRDDNESSVEKKDQEQQPQINEADLLAHAVLSADDGNFEIVPIVLPTLKSKFRAISLYIDSTGMIKDLPMNNRASKLATREIRGDAFLLSNHDDPALDDWKRVDTTMDDFQQLYEHPPAPMDMNNQTQASMAMAMREDLTKLVPEEDAKLALESLNQGRELFGVKNDFAAAADAFMKTITLLKNRTDLLPNDEELQKAKTVAMLNYAGCALKLNKFQDAENFSFYVLARDPGNEKAAYRLASAKMKMKDFAGSKEIISSVLRSFEKNAAASEQQQQQNTTKALWTQLDQECRQAESQHSQDQKKKFSKMFG